MANVYQSQYAKIAIRALNTDSASYALTASYAMNGGGGGGTPGGANTTVQFNDAGAFSGSGTFTFDKTTNTVRITGSAVLSGSVFMPGLTGSSAPQVLLYNTTTGRVSYTASSAFGGAGSGPGGSFNTIQYNNAGNFDGSNNFTFNSSNLVILTGSMVVSGTISASFGPNTVGFFGTASWAQSASQAVSSSYALTASYVATSSAAPSDTYIQYNKNGLLGAEQYFRYIYDSHSLQQGDNVVAFGDYSHAEGRNNYASASWSHVGGLQNTSSGIYQTVVGQNSAQLLSQSAFIVGGGRSTSVKNNALVVVPKTTTGTFPSDSILEVLVDTASISASYLYLNNLPTSPQLNVLLYNSESNQVFYTASSALGGGASGTPGGSNTQIQYNNNGVFGGVSNLTWNGTTLSATGSFTGSFTGSLFGTSSFATTASYALNGGVTQLLAGPNVTLSPTNGLGQVTITSTGGGGSSFNTATSSYGSFYSTQTQTNVAGTARSMSLNTTDITNGVSISGSTNPFNTYIKTENAGVYNIQFSAQVDKTDSGTDEIWIWIRKNGTDLTDTATSIQLTGNGAHYVAAWNFFVNAAANDYFQLMWYSPDANVRLHAESAFGVVPGIPSLIVTANRVDQFLSNTGSFTGSFTGEFTGSLFGTASYVSGSIFTNANPALSASYALTASYVSSNFQYEIHVSQVDGNDTTGDGSLLNPVATITKALTLLGASRKTIIIHPGTYSENVTVANTNTTISTSELTGANTLLSGTLTIGTLGSSTRISGLKMSSLVISGTAQAYISNCTVDTQVTKSSSGYVEIINSELQCTLGIQISGSGTTIINGNKNVGISVSNASAQVIVKGCNSVVTPSASAGNLAIVDCIVTALGGNGITITGPSTTLTLLNSQVLVQAGNYVAPISVAGIYSIINTIYDKPGSTFTGTSTNSIDYFQYINADKFITQGGTSLQYVMGDGSLSNGFTGGTVSGATNFTGGLTANTISATTYQNLPQDVFVTGGTYTAGSATFTNTTGGTFSVTGFPIGGGGGQTFYLNLSQTQNGNRLLSTTASTASEQTSGVTINNGVTGTIASFQSQPLNITLLPGGIWSFYLHSYKENTNAVFNIFVELYKITSGGTQTLLFATDPSPVTTNSPNPSMQLTDGYFSGTTLSISDSVVAVVRATNTGNQSHTITLVTEGSAHYSYVVSTIPTQQGLTCDTLSGCSIIQTIQTNITNKFDKSGGTVTGATNFTGGLTATTVSATTYENLPQSVSGGGTTNYVSKWTGSTGLGDSIIYDDGTQVYIGGGVVLSSLFSVVGPVGINEFQIQATAGSLGITDSDLTSWGTSGGEIAIGGGGPLAGSQGTGNIAIGYGVLKDNDTGIENIGIGGRSLYINQAGQYNVSIGSEAGANLTSGSYNVLIGFQAGYDITTEENKLYISNSKTNNLIYGEFDNKIVNIDGTLSATTYDNLPGSSSANCFTTFYVTNISGCSPVNVLSPLNVKDGLTVTGTSTFTSQANFTGGISASTFSATTYDNLPTDVFVSAGTYSNGQITFTNTTGGTFDVTNIPIGGAGGQPYYLNLSVSQTPYQEFSPSATTAAQQSTGVTINSGVTTTIANFLTPVGFPNITLIPSGYWSFYLHSYKADGSTTFDIFTEVYKRTTGGTETLLLDTDPTDVPGIGTATMEISDGYYSGTTLNASDRILVKVRATNTGNASSTITFLTEGTIHYSYGVTPFTNTSNVNSVSVSDGLSGNSSTGTIEIINTDKGSSQNIFKNIQVAGVTQFSAGSNSSNLNFSGINITITSAATNTLVFSAGTGGGGAVSSVTAGSGLSGNSTTGAITLINTQVQGITGITASSGVSASTSNNVVTLTNTGVTGITAGSNISINQSTGNVTISSTGGGAGLGTVYTTANNFNFL